MGNQEFDPVTPDTVTYFPYWKAGATAEERLLELAEIARAHPERFDTMIVVYNERTTCNRFLTRYITSGKEGSMHFVGLLEMAKNKLFEWINGDGE